MQNNKKSPDEVPNEPAVDHDAGVSGNTKPRSAPSVPIAVMKDAVDLTPPVSEKTPEIEKDQFDDPKIESAVKDITAHDSDEVLAAEDAEIAQAFAPKLTFRQKLKNFFIAWWGNKKARYGTATGLVVLILVLAILPPTRSFALNVAGMRATATVTILDDTTQLPLENVQVALGSITGVTNGKGSVTLQHVRLGSQSLRISKVAFAPLTKGIDVSLGKNTLGAIGLKAVGTQYKFKIVDYVSGQPLSTAQAVSGAADANADAKGNVVLTVKDPRSSTLAVNITAAGYRTTSVKVAVGTPAVTTVQLVYGRKEVYVSKQSGIYTVYKSDIDGQNKKVLLAGTGNENDQLTLVSNATDEEAALVSTRDNLRDSGGYLLQALTLINVTTGVTTTIDHSERIEIIDWIGDRLVYAEEKAGTSAGNPSRNLLMSYDYKTNQRLELDHANYFDDIVSAGGSIYYATSNDYSGGISQFLKINADNSGKQMLLNDEAWNIFRTDHNDFAVSTATSWYTYKLGDSKANSTPNAYSGTNRLYVDSPDGKHSAWVDNRDGKGTLIIYTAATGKETTLLSQSGLTGIVRWINNDTMIYRISNSQETADYVVSLESTAGKKITDVTNTTIRAAYQ